MFWKLVSIIKVYNMFLSFYLHYSINFIKFEHKLPINYQKTKDLHIVSKSFVRFNV